MNLQLAQKTLIFFKLRNCQPLNKGLAPYSSGSQSDGSTITASTNVSFITLTRTLTFIAYCHTPVIWRCHKLPVQGALIGNSTVCRTVMMY